ncbi:YkvI family membrane protein [Pseudomonas amygdali]|nr:hypothetical protein [Pseudomonas amygdali]KWS72893.1 hypothetical protein AL052_14915 [Pseudomonas amygdali pv. eriobotryae]
MKEILKIAGATAGIVVGAGFASGQEILQFFVSYRFYGLIGALLSGVLFAVYCVRFVGLGKAYEATSHADVVYQLCGDKFGRALDFLMSIFLFAVVVVMLAGGGALLSQLGIPPLYGSLIVALVSAVVVTMRIDWVVAFISGVTPCMALITVTIAIISIFKGGFEFSRITQGAASIQPVGYNWFHSAMLYASFCIFAGAPFLIILGGQASTKKAAQKGSLIGGAGFLSLLILIAAALLAQVQNVSTVEMPMVHLAFDISPALGILTSVVIFAMLLHTAVGFLYAVTSRIAIQGSRRFKLSALGLALAGFAGSQVGFVTLIGTVYPFFGYVGFALMLAVIAHRFTRNRSSAKAESITAEAAPGRI